MYVVVEFPNLQCSIIPITWLLEKSNKCYWPRSVKDNKQFDQMVRTMKPFNKSWPKYTICKIHLKTTTYKEAEDTLDSLLKNMESEESGQSTMSKKQVLINDDDDDSSTSSEVIDVPKKKAHILQNKFGSISAMVKTSTPVSTPPGTPTSEIYFSDSISTAGTKSAFQEKVLNMLTKLEEKVDQQSIIVNGILKNHRDVNIQSLKKPKDIPSLPITNLVDFENFDKMLITREDVRAYLIHRLAAVGGSGVDSHTRRVLKFLISDDVALQYNWKGRDKLSFQKTKTMSIIYSAVKKSFLQEGNDLIIENSVKEWLKYAKTRIGMASKKRSLTTSEDVMST